MNKINSIVSFLVSNKAVKSENSYGYSNVSIEIQNNYGLTTVYGYHSFHLNDGHGVKESLFNIHEDENQYDIFLSYCDIAFKLYDNNIIGYDNIARYLTDNAVVVNNDVFLNDWEQIEKYRHTHEEELESASMLRFRYNVILDSNKIDRNIKDYKSRFEIYRKMELFNRFPILNELEGFNDKIICNLLYALFMLNNLEEAVKDIRKDVLRCYGPDWYTGLTNSLNLKNEEFHYLFYLDGQYQYVYLEKLN